MVRAVNAKLPPITEDTMPGELPNIVAGRVANVLNLRVELYHRRGVCVLLAAINAAFEMLTEHHIDAVIAGGVDATWAPPSSSSSARSALSATGSRPFGEGADGFVMGEGSASFLLKRLTDAERDGDKIYAVIRGVGSSSDGKGKGITAPNPQARSAAMRGERWARPATATLLEAHGTSTKVGDVVEVESLTHVFGENAAAQHRPGVAKATSAISRRAPVRPAAQGDHGRPRQTVAATLNCGGRTRTSTFSNSPFYLL